MIKEIKRSRLPKEVLFLIGLLNDDKYIKYDDNGKRTIEYNDETLFALLSNDFVDNTIIPYYRNMYKVFENVKTIKTKKEHQISEVKYKEQALLAISNSIYSDYTLFEW